METLTFLQENSAWLGWVNAIICLIVFLILNEKYGIWSNKPIIYCAWHLGVTIVAAFNISFHWQDAVWQEMVGFMIFQSVIYLIIFLIVVLINRSFERA